MLTITSIRPTDNTPPAPSSADREALGWAKHALATLVATLERHRWQHDDAHIGPHAAILDQARRDYDAVVQAEAAATLARQDAYTASRVWVREAVL